jgi:chorismate mutase
MVTLRLHKPVSARPQLRAVRGAVTAEADTPAAIDAAVATLLTQLTDANGIAPDDVVSAIFSSTPDLRSRHPAASARALGWSDVPMMCVAELEIDGALARCVRVLLHVSVCDGRRLTPVYLGDAASLRPDLTGIATSEDR